MKNYLFIIILVIFSNCATTKPITHKKANKNAALENAISDFMHCRLSKNKNVFAVNFHDNIDTSKLIAISIMPLDFFYHITLIDTVGSKRLPTRHVIKDGKLFYWYDSDYGLTKELVLAFAEYNLIDSVNHANLLLLLGEGSYFNDFAKAANYYFCKDNPTNYKRDITNIAIGWYTPPKLKCNK